MIFDLLNYQIILALVLIGAIAGFSAGLLGIGGGMIIVPILTMIFTAYQFPQSLILKMAIATSMATIVFTSLSSIRSHQKKNAINWQLMMQFTPGILLGSFLASMGVFSWIKGQYLALFFACFVGYSAYKMLTNAKKPEREFRSQPLWILSLVGILVGFLSGLVGAGGGFLMVPYMVYIGVPMQKSVAISAATGFPIALFNSIGFIFAGQSLSDLPEFSLGYIYTPALIVISLVSVFFAPLGAKAAHVLPVAQLKRIFGCVLIILAFYMFIKGLEL